MIDKKIDNKICLHRHGAGHAAFCEVGQKSPSGQSGIQRYVESEQLAISVGFELEDFPAHHRFCADVLLRHSRRRT